MDFSTLNPQQEKAVRAPEKPLLIVAGAGTGKTRTLMARLLYLIEQGADPRTLCAITFTNKAAGEMQERAGKQIAYSLSHTANQESSAIRNPRLATSRLPFIGTFHSLGARILREHARLAGRTAGFTIFDTDDSFSLIKKILKRFEVAKNERFKPSLISRKISAIKNGSLSLEVLESSRREDDRKTAEVFREYEKNLAENNAFDFDDLLLKTVELLSYHAAIRESYQKRYTHILVDEYQDINKTQYELLRLLSGSRNAITVVGDDAQMIYSWRNADIQIFLDFEKDWPGAQTIILDQNYRSTPTIITAASALIAKNQKQKTKTLWTNNPDGARVDISEWGNEDEEARNVVGEIQKLKIKNQNEGVAVLYRTNAQSRAVEQALLEAGIPYQVFGGLKFYERKEIRDIIAALRFIANPKDSVSRERLEKTFYQKKTALILDHLLRFQNKKTSEIIEEFLRIANYFEYLDAHFTNADERRENIAELIYVASAHDSLSGFLESASLLQSGDASNGKAREAGSGRLEVNSNTESLASPLVPLASDFPPPASSFVHLMTIHLAKGLEFDHVFLIGCREDLMPHAFSLESEAQIEEERRLLYVAMTRARKTLHLSYHDIPSRFLFEIPEEFTTFRSPSGDEIFSDAEERYISID